MIGEIVEGTILLVEFLLRPELPKRYREPVDWKGIARRWSLIGPPTAGVLAWYASDLDSALALAAVVVLLGALSGVVVRNLPRALRKAFTEEPKKLEPEFMYNPPPPVPRSRRAAQRLAE